MADVVFYEYLIVEKVPTENIKFLDPALTGIMQWLPTYKKKCSELIVEICKCSSASDAEQSADSMSDIQGWARGLAPQVPARYRFEARNPDQRVLPAT